MGQAEGHECAQGKSQGQGRTIEGQTSGLWWVDLIAQALEEGSAAPNLHSPAWILTHRYPHDPN